MIPNRKLNDAVYYAQDSLVHVGQPEMDFLKERVENTPQNRVRLCAHRDPEDALHEMFIVLSAGSYVRPAKHLDKAESLLVLEGSADAIFFDEDGDVAQVISLGDYASGKRFYYRIAEPTYHTLLVHSRRFVFHESTHGPFKSESTVPAPWAPAENDSPAVSAYLEGLRERAARFLSNSRDRTG